MPSDPQLVDVDLKAIATFHARSLRDERPILCTVKRTPAWQHAHVCIYDEGDYETDFRSGGDNNATWIFRRRPEAPSGLPLFAVLIVSRPAGTSTTRRDYYAAASLEDAFWGIGFVRPAYA